MDTGRSVAVKDGKNTSVAPDSWPMVFRHQVQVSCLGPLRKVPEDCCCCWVAQVGRLMFPKPTSATWRKAMIFMALSMGMMCARQP